jgi:hypothetical protein
VIARVVADESVCHRCGGPNIVWFAPSPLWNAVMRGQAEPYELHDGIVCPTCFGILADEAGLGGIFRLDVSTPSERTVAEREARFDKMFGLGAAMIRLTAGAGDTLTATVNAL